MIQARRTFLAIVATALFFTVQTPTRAADLSFEQAVDAMRGVALDAQIRREGGRHILTVVVREQDLHTMVPKLQREGQLNPDMTATRINRQRFGIAWVWVQQGAAAFVNDTENWGRVAE
jgi:hypothetical protein